MEQLPKRVTVTRSYTYDLGDMRQSFMELHGEYLSDDELMDMIWEWAKEDHQIRPKDRELIMVDSDTGEEV